MLDTLEQQLMGPAQSLMSYFKDPEVTDILLNGVSGLFIEKDGKLEELSTPFKTESELFHFVERLLVASGKQLDATVPSIDGKCVDGSRFNIILPPLAQPGPLISIRKKKPSGVIDLDCFGDEKTTAWLKECVQTKKNFLISGATGSGKTTLLSSLISEVSSHERVVLIEEVSEINPSHGHVIHLEARPANTEGKGEVSVRSLLRTALRIRPDRIVVGECRGPEAFEMLQAMNTGHRGSWGTLHANSARDALRRFESLALLSGVGIPLKVVREWISSNIHGVIHLEKRGNKRSISSVLTLQGLEGEVYRWSSPFPGLSDCNF